MKKYEVILSELVELSENATKSSQESRMHHEKLKALCEKLKELIAFMDDNAMDLATVIGDLSTDNRALEDSGMEILGELGELNEDYQTEKENLVKAIQLLEENGIEIARNFGELYEEKIKIEKKMTGKK